MQIAIIGSEAARAGWASNALPDTTILAVQQPEEAPPSALLIDLLFDGTALRLEQLATHAGPVWVADVPGAATGTAFVRINGWPGAEAAPDIEASAPPEARAAAEQAAIALGKRIVWLPATPGFVTPRVIAGIINEGYHALQEGVSSKEDINTALKLGTNYPFGPFEWAERIGLREVAALLQVLAQENPRYEPSPLLLQETGV